MAVAIAKLGGNSYFAGKVGDDSFGHFLNSSLKNYNVNTDYLTFTKDAKTALAFVSLKTNGERDFLFYRNPSADMLISPEEVDESWFEGDEIFHFCSNSLSYRVSAKATKRGIELAKRKEALVSFDPNIRFPFWTSKESIKESIFPLLTSVDILKISEEELHFLFGTNNENNSVQQLLNFGISLIIVTKGSQGSSYYTKNISGNISSPRVKTIDTTGAGDAFVGGLLYQLSLLDIQQKNLQRYFHQKDNLDNIVQFSSVCGAVATTERGAMTALPSVESIKAILQHQ